MELEATDENLMLRYQAGEAPAFSELYRRYQRRLYGYLRHKVVSGEMAEEIFQNVWAKLHQSRWRYDAKFKFSAWFFTIAHSVMVDAFRKESKFAKLSSLEEERFSNPREVSESFLPSSDLPWGEISAEDKQALEWRYLEEASFEEIGRRLALSPVNIRQRISRALRKLKQGLDKEKV